MNNGKISKLKITLNQWTRIKNKEMAISEDLRNNRELEQAKMMIAKINMMIAKEENTVNTNDFPELKRTYKYKNSTVIKANDINL